MADDVVPMMLAYALKVAMDVVHADERIAVQERVRLLRAFPKEDLRAEGLLDEAGELTPRFGELAARAEDELPGKLSPEEKGDLLVSWCGMVIVDNHVDDRELVVVREVAVRLGLDDAAVDAAMERAVAIKAAAPKAPPS
jgi:hypothetical protein